MKKLKRVLNLIAGILLWSFLALSVLMMAFVMVIKFSGGRPTIFGLGFYQIVSGSMQPELKVNDVIAAKSFNQNDVKVGDNLVFNHQGKIITHKLIQITESGQYVMHGSANPTDSNEYITPSQVIARQVFVLKGFGVMLDFLRSPYGFFLLIFAPLSGLIIYQTVGLSKRLKAYKKTEDKSTLPDSESSTPQADINSLPPAVQQQINQVAQIRDDDTTKP